jgi:DNA-binding CsgD family transcriptional regulator
LHRCDNPSCINPDHLFLGTQLDNMRDMYAKGRQNPRIGANNGRAALTDKQVLEILGLLAEGVLSQKSIGARYRIAQTTVSNIKRGGWQHLKEKL